MSGTNTPHRGFPHGLAITQLIQENFAIVLTYAFSQPALRAMTDEEFKGYWKFLEKACFEIAERRANRALLEVATQLRTLDGVQDLDSVWKRRGGSFGRVTQTDDTETELYFRDLTNKVVHSADFTWDFSNPKDPTVTALPIDPKRWKKATIQIVQLAMLCGTLGS
jgi:hypothetical protein